MPCELKAASWVKTRKGDMKYYSQYRIHDLFELQGFLSGLSKSNRWVNLADRLS